MFKLILSALSLILLSMNGYAQNNIFLNIHHKLADIDFALEEGAKNNLDNDFEVTRLEYYISNITLVHDGGAETVFDKVWVLVNAANNTQIELGSNNINTVESVKLNIGIGPNQNHLDPAIYPGSHPLAPQNPSMHWGWAAGYRFVAFEGNGGSNYDQSIELHGLGDSNYFTTEIPLTAEANNNEIIIDLNADYTRALEDVNVNSGVIVHGDYGAAQKCLENFRDLVFSEANETTATIDFSEITEFKIFPNPAREHASVSLSASKALSYQIVVTDILGRQKMFFDDVNSNSTIDLAFNESGIYFVQLVKDGHVIITKRFISE